MRITVTACAILTVLLLATFATSGDERPTPRCVETERIGKLEAEVAELREDQKALRRELGKQREILELLFRDPPGIPAPLKKAPPPRISGKVKAVNQDLNVVILSVGSDERVKVGYEFTIYRGNEYVATVVIDKVEQNHSSGHSKKEIEKSPIKVGDLAANRF